MIPLKMPVIVKERTFTKVAALLLAVCITELAGYALAAAETEVEEVVGKIVSLDPTAHMLTIEARQGEMTVYVDEKTKITMRREERLFSDLKVGDKVKIHYATEEGKERAERIMVKHRKEEGSKKGASNQRLQQ